MVEFLLRINLDGMLSDTYSRIPPPYLFRSNIKVQYPSILNCIVGKESFYSVSVIIITSTFPLKPSTNWTNLWRTELILICARMRWPIFLCEGYLNIDQNKWFYLNHWIVDFWKSFHHLRSFQKGSFDFVLKPSKNSDSLCVTLIQLERPFKYLTKFSCNFLEPLMFKCNLILLKIS